METIRRDANLADNEYRLKKEKQKKTTPNGGALRNTLQASIRRRAHREISLKMK